MRDSRRKRVFQNQLVCTGSISELLRVARTCQHSSDAGGYSFVGHKYIAIVQADPLLAMRQSYSQSSSFLSSVHGPARSVTSRR